VGDEGAGKRRPESRGPSRERSRDDVLAAARPLPPDEDVLMDDLTEDEDRLSVRPTIRSSWLRAGHYSAVALGFAAPCW
jgi:hypothetical protein